MSHIARSALIIAAFIALEKLLGFVRQVIIARQFGLSAELDAFNAANNLPDLIFALISGGALAVAFIPVLSEYLEIKNRDQMWDLFSRILNLVFLVTAGISAVIVLLANQLVSSNLGIAPGFTSDQQALVVDLMRLNLVATLLFSIAGLVIAGLQANQHFLLPALARSMYDIGTIIGVVILAPENGYTISPITLPSFGLGVYGLVYGTILGAFLFLAVQIPGLIHYKFRWTPAINLRHPGVRQVLHVMIPRVGTVFFIYLVLVYIPDNIASRLAQGSVTALVFGWLFMQVPETLIGTAIATALLPTISEKMARADVNGFRRSVNDSFRVILALAIPSSILLMILIPPVIGILGFDQAGTDMVVWTARAFLVGLTGHALLELAARSFYAQQDARTPLWASFLLAVTFTILAILLAMQIDVAGIALANSIAFTGQALLLLYLLNRRFPGVLRAGRTLPRVVFGTLMSALVVLTLTKFPISELPLTVFALGVGIVVMTPFIWPEIKLLIKLE